MAIILYLNRRSLPPSLQFREWLIAKPMKLLDHGERWERLIAVLDWLRRHPRPGIYVRQMDIPGVDTKFIESYEGILTELFGAMTPGTDSGPNPDGRKPFETRFGFLFQAG